MQAQNTRVSASGRQVSISTPESRPKIHERPSMKIPETQRRAAENGRNMDKGLGRN